MKTPEEIIKKCVKPKSKVVLAFSGGPDSVYLLQKLIKFDFDIIIAHFNHKLRGKDSDLDEKFSENSAKKLKIKFESDSFDIKKYAKSKKLNLEEAARNKRYEFLRKIKQKYNADLIVTAHHANDNLETFFINFLRGSGAIGLKGMQILNNDLFRPLLYVPKSKIMEFLNKNKIEFRTDKSNTDAKILRNNLRLNVIPKLEQIQPEILTIFNRNIENLNEIYSIIKKQADDWVEKNLIDENEIKLASIKGLSKEFLKQILIKIYENLYGSTINLSSETLNRSLELINAKKTGKKTSFGSDIFLTLTSNSLKFIQKKTQKSIKKKKLKIPGKTKFEYGEISLKIIKNYPKNLKKGIYVDYSKLKTPLYIRAKSNGDKFTPFGLKGTKKLKNYFIDKKIPAFEKIKTPIITDKFNEIVAVGDLTINDKYKILKFNKKKTNHYLEISLKTAKI